MSTQKKRVVILGGGIAGLPLARQIEANKKLSASLDVTLVDKKQYFENNLASPRFLVAPAFHGKVAALYETYLNKTRLVFGEIRTIHAIPQQVEVATQQGGTEFIPFDYLIISLGTRYEYFKAATPTLQERVAQVTEMSQRIANANHVLVVGGRAVGVEVAGEILEVHPNKQITIVHPLNSLMDDWSKGAISRLNNFIAGKGKNINVVLGKKLVRSEGNRHELSDGSFIEADLKILATGNTPNSEPLRQFFGAALTPSGYVKVRPTLQVEGFENIFALGDIAEIENHAKLAANSKAQVSLLMKNLQATLNNANKLNPIGGPMLKSPGLLTMGPSFGILAMFGISTSGKFFSNLKTDMFIKMTKEP